MTQETFNTIKSSIGRVFNDITRYYEQYYFRVLGHEIGTEKQDYHARKQKKQVEYFCVKTGKNRKKTIYDYPSYIYTEEMFKKDRDIYVDFNTHSGNTAEIWVKCQPDDTLTMMSFQNPYNPTDHEIETLYNHMSTKYRDKITGFKVVGGTVYPTFDEETQRAWDIAVDRFNSRMQDYCDRYGCE